MPSCWGFLLGLHAYILDLFDEDFAGPHLHLSSLRYLENTLHTVSCLHCYFGRLVGWQDCILLEPHFVSKRA